MKKVQSIVWQGILINTLEFLTLEMNEKIYAEGNIVGVYKDKPLQVTYAISLDANWNIRHVVIERNGDSQFSLALKKDDSNRWYDSNGNHLAEFDDRTEIDISFTPFTNSLPINRLRLTAGQSQEINVVYINLANNEIKKARQRYTNLDNNRYMYENISSGFTAVVEVDQKGIVVDYPGVWKRLVLNTKN